ncbi:MAG: hypothetical protein BBJ57_07390 [Desulfobacterales bacterium PC51MH44]|nr:MAG: hypothetical protein BBJ57_07390 [Desulfobacterales bacterium PC51MH44]
MRLRTIFTTVALAVLLGCMILFTSCANVNAFLESESGQAVMDHGGVIAGVMVGSNNLDKIDEGVKICDEYLKAENETIKQAALEAATVYIFKKYGQTPQTMVIMAEVQKLAGVFMKDGKLGFLDNYNPELLGKFVLSFRNGLAMATPRQTKFIR